MLDRKTTENKIKTNNIYRRSCKAIVECYASFGLANRPLAKLFAHAMEASRSACTESLLSTIPSTQQISISSQEIDRDSEPEGWEKWASDSCWSEALEWQGNLGQVGRMTNTHCGLSDCC